MGPLIRRNHEPDCIAKHLHVHAETQESGFLPTTCVLLGLFSSLHLCSGKFGTPITDDVSKLSVLKQNIPSDYEIPVGYIPREVAGTCWVVLNIYPLERSLEKLASMFGDMSSNRDDVNVFVTMLKSLRLTFDHEDRKGEELDNTYRFNVIQKVRRRACPLSHFVCVSIFNYSCNYSLLAEGQEESRKYRWLKSSSLLLVLIPFTACIVLIVWQVRP
uniref:Kit ligand n=1 Tax=Xiphophorus couchianus TaxID=32473 RepID=A0A3B5M4P9_9TELE